MTDGSPHTDPAALRREPQVLGSDELVVYEAIATMRGPMETDAVVAATGLEEATVRAAVERLTELKMVVQGEDGTSIGPNDWDVRGAK